MTGLRDWVRDPGLPAESGQPELSPPSPEEMAEILTAHALAPGADPPAEILWDYARWKPGVSITCAYRLRWSDGHEQILVAKRYAGDKVRFLVGRKDRSAELQPLSPRVRPRVLLPEQSLSLWCPAGDRELPGVAFLLDVKRFASLVKNSGITAPGLIRRRRSEYQPLRYKAEHRAVFRARLKLRDEARTQIVLAARVLPLEEGQRIAATRRELEVARRTAGGAPAMPELLGSHDRYGILLEEWLNVIEAHEPGDFAHARAAGRALAELHRLPVPLAAVGAGDDDEEEEHLRALFSISAELSEAYRGLHRSAASESTWIHGDFHPDQVAVIERGGERRTALLDLDRVSAGDPARDLASWVADDLFEREDQTFEAACAPLLEGYERALDEGHLRLSVADELVRRAAAAVRRLERGAVERAARCLERARAIPLRRPTP